MNYRAEQLIESYFANALSEAESQELKTLLASDQEAAAEFAWQQSLARQVSKLSLSKSIQNDTLRQAAKPPFRRVNMWRTLLVAAAALALVVVAYLFIPGSGNSEALVAASFEHFPNKMKFKNLGASEETVPPDVLEAFAEYDKKNYTAAAAKLTTIANANPTRIDFRFYQGVAQIGAHQYREAIAALTAVADDASSTYSTASRYYLGVAYAHEKDIPQAKKYLEAYMAAADGVTFRDQAGKLLKALK